MHSLGQAGVAANGFIMVGQLLLLLLAACFGAYGSIALTSWMGVGSIALSFAIGSYVETQSMVLPQKLSAYVVAGSCGVSLVLSSFSMIPTCVSMLAGILTAVSVIVWQIRNFR